MHVPFSSLLYHLGVVAFPCIAPLWNLYSFFEETELNVINYNRGYHTAAWRYEFYFRLVKTVFFYEGVQWMSPFSCTSWSSQNSLPFIRRENIASVLVKEPIDAHFMFREDTLLWAHSNWHKLIWCCHHNWGAQCGATSEYPHHLLQYFEKHRIQWNFSFGTPIFRGHKILSWKNIHIIFVFVTPVEGTSLIREKGHFFWVLKPGFNLHKMWLTTKITDKF